MANGLTNGHTAEPTADLGPQRFSAVPDQLDIPVSGGEGEEAVEIDLLDLQDDPSDLCTLLENESVPGRFWITISLAYAKQANVETAVEVIRRGLDSVGQGNQTDKLPLLNALCWYYLFQSRDAPRTRLDTKVDADTRNKDYYLRSATGVINEAMRINPSFAPLSLARGVLSLLRAALFPADDNAKLDALRSAIKAFDESLRASTGQNMMAALGRARAMYSMGKYGEAIKGYQRVLEKAPDMVDPDPRIGIGACFWALGHHEDAKLAWERALELNPNSKIANVLLGIQTLEQTSRLSSSDPRFQDLYSTAMAKYVQTAFKLDQSLPLACSTFASYFVSMKGWKQAEKLAKKAVELTDVSSIASDGWYLLARKEHYAKEPARAGDYYVRADQARGGDQKGHIPAKFGSAQVRIMQGDPDGAKFRLEKIVQQSKNIEAMTVLGTLWADDAFSGRAGSTKEELIAAQKRAIPLLEQVRTAWKDPKRNVSVDTSVLLNLARLYEADNPDRAMQCLQQAEEALLEEVAEEDLPEDLEDEAVRLAAMREHLPPQLLNNIACFHYQSERFGEAVVLFETALRGCVRLGNQDPPVDTSALLASISFNLGRAYEAENNLADAQRTYEQLLERNPGYLDARMRLVNIALRQSPTGEGPELMRELYEAESQNLDVRALYGWYLRKAKKRVNDINQDQEQRHYKHSLSSIDRHDRYSLTAMGNMHLTIAREMRRETDVDRERRSKMYAKCVEFFEKALQLDPRNAYAAQGIGIALVEDKRDFASGLQVFSKVRETIKDASVYVNLGHTYMEVKQYARAIEAYEAALSKDRQSDPQILACLGRAWLTRGKLERTVPSLKASLDYSKRALEAAPEQIHFKFNVAFVQIQIAQMLHSLPETQRTLEDIETAAEGLDEAIAAFEEMSKAKNAPFPRQELEQRASMGKNTMKRQLERAAASQKEYEGRNADRLAKARQARDAEIAKREEEAARVKEEQELKARGIREERERMMERDREVAERRKEEAQRKLTELGDESGEDGEKRERRRKGGSKRKKKGDVVGDGTDDNLSDAGVSGGDADAERPRKTKKRKLERPAAADKPKKPSKYKSADFIDSDEDLSPAPNADGADEDENIDLGDDVEREDVPMDDEADQPDPDEVVSAAPAAGGGGRRKRVVDDEEDDEDGDVGPVSEANGLGMDVDGEE